MFEADLPMTRLQLEGFRNTAVAIIQNCLAGATDMEVYEFLRELMNKGDDLRPEFRECMPTLAAFALFDELKRRYEIRELEGN